MVQKVSVSVYRNASGYDCTNGGASSTHRQMVLYSGDRQACLEQIMLDGNQDDALYLNKRMLWGEKKYYATPLPIKERGFYNFGGNFVYTSDARFAEMLGETTARPLPVWDRVEP